MANTFPLMKTLFESKRLQFREFRFVREAWDNGYATEAAIATLKYGFVHLVIPEITAIAHIENIASLRVIEKIGFQFIKDEILENTPVKTHRLTNPYLPAAIQ